MSVYPKWLLCLVFPCLLSVLASPFYLFGGLALFGHGGNAVTGFLLYLLQNLVWGAPVLLFFASLNVYGRGHEKTGVAIAIAGLALMVLSFVLLFR